MRWNFAVRIWTGNQFPNLNYCWSKEYIWPPPPDNSSGKWRIGWYILPFFFSKCKSRLKRVGWEGKKGLSKNMLPFSSFRVCRYIFKNSFFFCYFKIYFLIHQNWNRASFFCDLLLLLLHILLHISIISINFTAKTFHLYDTR